MEHGAEGKEKKMEKKGPGAPQEKSAVAKEP